MDAMAAEGVIKFLQSYVLDPLQASDGGQPVQGVTAVSCVDGRLNNFLRPFRFVIRAAGAIAEAVEGSVGLAGEATGATFLATHGDCLAYQAAIDYLSASLAGGRRQASTVANLNRHDTRTLLTYINTQWRLDALPARDDQKALSMLGISYAVQWSARNSSDKPRVGLFVDTKSVLAKEARVWIVSYDSLAGPRLADFLKANGMKTQTIGQHVVLEPPR